MHCWTRRKLAKVLMKVIFSLWLSISLSEMLFSKGSWRSDSNLIVWFFDNNSTLTSCYYKEVSLLLYLKKFGHTRPRQASIFCFCCENFLPCHWDLIMPVKNFPPGLKQVQLRLLDNTLIAVLLVSLYKKLQMAFEKVLCEENKYCTIQKTLFKLPTFEMNFMIGEKVRKIRAFLTLTWVKWIHKCTFEQFLKVL